MQELPQSRIPTFVKIGLTLLFIAAGVIYVVLRKDEFLALDWPTSTAILAIAAAFTTNLVIMGLFNALTARKLGANISVRESVALSVVTSAANFVLPMRAGTGLRGIYMKRVHQLDFSRFASTLVVFYLCNVLVASLLGTAAVAAAWVDDGSFAVDLFVAFPMVFLASVAVIVLRRAPESTAGDGLPWWIRMRDGFREILGQTSVVLWAIGLVLLSFVVSTLAWHLALSEYVSGVSIPDAFLIVASQVVGGLVPLTAGGTGIQELAGIYVGHRLDMTIVNLFAVLVWTKVLRIAIALVASVPAGLYLNRKLAEQVPNS